ncbi:MAG: carboxypeptidase regulatory-like domain-containing protein [Spirosoma sp.]|nr:carboxypeptidase regulatory-like domain-containing protein [Spirosoma sp.]
MRTLLSVFLLWLCAGIVLAQTPGSTLTGRVLDAKTGEPLPFASVYINNTSRGTTADSSGNYRLSNVPPGNQELIGSLLGYQTRRQPLRLTDTRPRQIDLKLEPGQMLAGVTVTARHSKVWQRQFREFSRELLGNRPQARQCQIMNPSVLSFQSEKGYLLAQAAEPLVITNEALGYRLHYDLMHFDLYQGHMNFAGTSRFEELTPISTKQQTQWQRNRQRAYLGSLQHLLISLLSGTHERAGYTVYQTPLTGDDTNAQVLPLVRTAERLFIGPDQARALFQPGDLPFERRLVSEYPLEVYYNRVYATNSPYHDSPYAYSMLLLPNKLLELTLTGGITQGNGLDVRGYLGNDRLATLLPLDWVSAEDETLTPANIAEGKPQRADAGLDSLVAQRERAVKRTAPLVFVQTDKGFYCTGDQLWLSAYVLNAARQLPVAGRTGAVQVELIAPDGHIVQHQWLKLTDGRAATSFRFGDTLSAGQYRLRAYTDRDQVTNGPAFERLLSVCNLRQSPPGQSMNQVAAAVGVTGGGTAARPMDSLDVQVLPEGGRWLAGVSAVLGIKAITTSGRGRAIGGRVVDKSGAEVARFATNALGIGRVTLTPQAGQTYAALPDPILGVTTRPVALPVVESEGWALAADAVTDSTLLTVTARATGPYDGQPVYVTLQSREQLAYRQKWSLQHGEARFTLPIGTLPPGVCRLTLWDVSGQPRAERLVFVPERDEGIRMQVTTGKPRYEARQTVGIGLRFHDADGYPVGGSWSAAVTDADQLPADTLQPDMRTNLLLTAGLRGQIESPDYYLQPDRLSDLDNLLLTQGWRRLPAPQPADTTGGWNLSGRVTDKKGQPVTNATVVVQLQQGVQKAMRSLRTDAGGVFRLTGLQVADTVRVLANVTEPSGATLRFNAPGLPFPTPVLYSVPDGLASATIATSAWLTDAQRRQAAWPAFYRDSTARQLAEVVVQANKTAPERPLDIQRSSLHGYADATLIVDENVMEMANGILDLIRRLPGVIVDGNGNIHVGGFSSFGDSSPLFLLDGQSADGETVASVPLREISRIELLKTAGTAGIYGSRAAGGVIAVYTRKGRGIDPLPERTSVAATAAGFALPREFYVPRYDLAEPDPRPDRRDVLFWQPLGESGPDGLGNLAFPLNDTAKRLRIVVQGVSNEGVPISFTWVLPVR